MTYQKEHWKKCNENAWFRSDHAYAGIDHTKHNKTFIALAPFVDAEGGKDELRNFKTIEAAIAAADRNWPLDTTQY